MGQRNRCFLGVKLKPVIEYSDRLKKLMTGRNIKISVGNPTNYHITLHFFGDITKEQIEIVKENLRSIKFQPFRLKTRDTGSFPNNLPKRTKILYLGFEDGVDELLDLQKNVVSRIKKNFSIPTRPFRSHLTIGRIKFGNEVEIVTNEWLGSKFKSTEFDISEVLLIQSNLTSTGPNYTTLEKFSADG